MDRRVRIRKKYWWLRFVDGREIPDDRGDCDSPSDKNKTIRVRQGLKGEERLEVLIHEMLHAAFWDADEVAIEETAEDMARVLTLLGYREGE